MDERRVPIQSAGSEQGRQVLITGGAGFIGANLARLLLCHGYRVRVLDNFSTGDQGSLEGLDVEVEVGDIQDSSAVLRAVEDCWAVVHLAAQTSVLESVQDPLPTFRVNAKGTFLVLEAAKRIGVEKFVLASSNAALGEHAPPLREQMVPRPISPYGASKLAAEGYCSAYHGAYDLGTVVLRFANAYGPYCANKTSVIAKFLRQLMVNDPISIYGDGTQTRDFIYVDDIARAILLALQSSVGGTTFQIGTGREVSVQDLITLLVEVTGSQSVIQHTPAQPGEIQRNYSAIDRARDVLGFEAAWGLRDGIQATLAWMESQPALAGMGE